MLKKLFLLLVVAMPAILLAQDKIAYVSAQEIFAKMPEYAAAQTKLTTKRETAMKTAQAIEQEYQTLLEKYKNDSTEISESILMDRQKQVQQLEERYQNFIQTSNAEFEKEQEALLTPIQQKLMSTIKDVGDENGITYIFDRAALLYVSASAVDITPKVKTKLGITN